MRSNLFHKWDQRRPLTLFLFVRWRFSTWCHIHDRWCSRSLPRHSSVVGDGKSSVFSLSETWKLCINVSSELNLPASNSFSLLTREIFNIRTIHLLQNCWFILPCPKMKKSNKLMPKWKGKFELHCVAMIPLSNTFNYTKRTYISWGAWSKSSQRCFILQTQDKFKLLCRKYKQ